jgi:NAD(P)H-hydrate epimerase
VLVIAGKGNNGGDGFVAARALAAAGHIVRVFLLAAIADLKGDAARACREYVAAGGVVIERADQAAIGRERPAVVVDALFGTGLNALVQGASGDMIEAVNRLDRPIVAVDIASGINADNGAVLGVAIKAALTVTFGFAKYGHVSYPGADYCGDLEVADIGFAPAAVGDLNPRGRLIDAAEARSLITPRARNTHKGNYGHALIIAGARGKGGAAMLVGRGALRSGAGLVTAAIPQCVAAIVAGGQAELMTEPIADHDGHFAAAPTIERLEQLITGKDVIIVGPGIGTSDDIVALMTWLIREGAPPERPVLIDADGLNALALIGPAHLRSAHGPVVLTPHPGEMARLLDTTTAAVNADRIGAARKLADLTGALVVLKGARSVIVGVAGEVAINSSGNPGMATPGMGDVMSGIIGALMGQGMRTEAAVTLGVFVHGHAADRLAARVGRFGYLAGDLANELPTAFSELGA